MSSWKTDPPLVLRVPCVYHPLLLCRPAPKLHTHPRPPTPPAKHLHTHPRSPTPPSPHLHTHPHPQTPPAPHLHTLTSAKVCMHDAPSMMYLSLLPPKAASDWMFVCLFVFLLTKLRPHTCSDSDPSDKDKKEISATLCTWTFCSKFYVLLTKED